MSGAVESLWAGDATIAALSSAPGKAAVSVVRISGAATAEVLARCTTPWSRRSTSLASPRHAVGAKPGAHCTTSPNGNDVFGSTKVPISPRRATRKYIVHPETGDLIDDALVLYFPGPHSVTGEDVAEFHVHGSRAVVSATLDALLAIPNVRLAEAGEFTRRSVENDKLDLTEVEGLGDLLNAETEAQRRQALRQLGGHMSAQYDAWREEIVGCLAHVEAFIDFGDEEDDVTEGVYNAVADRLEALARELERHICSSRGELVRDGVRVALVGPPNVGKSSLLNALANRPAAIVSNIPGTTRDIVEVSLNIAGYVVRVTDTAGVRATDDAVEQEGVLRARQASSEADIRVCVFDATTFPGGVSADVMELVTPESMVVFNKLDLLGHGEQGSSPQGLPELPRGVQTSSSWGLSCVTHAGLTEFLAGLGSRVEACVTAGQDGSEDVVVTRARHREHLIECLGSIRSFLDHPAQVDLAAEELRLAVISLGRVTGRVDVEELLDVVFRDFCIGK